MDTATKPPLELIRAAVTRTRNAQLILSVVVFALAALMCTAYEPQGTMGSKLRVGVVAGLFALMGAGFVWIALVKNHPERSPLMVALRDRPELVVWIYAQDVEVVTHGIKAPVRDRNVIAKLADGTTAALTVKKDRADDLLAAIASLATDAAQGFSPEREAQFRKDPRSLARSMQPS